MAKVRGGIRNQRPARSREKLVQNYSAGGKKMNETVNRYLRQGYTIEREGVSRINQRSYKYVILKKGDKRITVNHQGGTEGLVSVIGKTT